MGLGTQEAAGHDSGLDLGDIEVNGATGSHRCLLGLNHGWDHLGTPGPGLPVSYVGTRLVSKWLYPFPCLEFLPSRLVFLLVLGVGLCARTARDPSNVSTQSCHKQPLPQINAFYL